MNLFPLLALLLLAPPPATQQALALYPEGRVLPFALALPEEAAREDTASEDTASEDTASEEAAPQDADVASARLREEPLALWVWGDSFAPRRIAKATFGGMDLATDLFPPDKESLRVRILLGEKEKAAGLRLIAAPRGMWSEVPEDLLPSWPVPQSGRLEIPLHRNDAWRLRLVGASRGSWWREVRVGQKAVELKPRQAENLYINLSAEVGRNVVGVEGRLFDPARVASREDDGSLAIYRASATGLILPTLPDAAPLLLLLRSTEYAPAAFEGPPSSLPRRIMLRPGASLRGLLVAADGEPVPDAFVTVRYFAAPGISRLFIRSVRGAADGSWLLAGLPPGQVALGVEAAGRAVEDRLLELAVGELDLGRMVLAPGQGLRVRVVDPAGVGVAAASVRRSNGFSVLTGPEGEVELGSIPATGPVLLRATAEGFVAREITLPAPDLEPRPTAVEIELTPAFTVSGRLLDPTGVPVAEGVVRVETGSSDRQVSMHPDGRFIVHLAPGVAATLVLAGPHTREVNVTVPAGPAAGHRELGDVTTPPGLAISGRLIRAADGTPVAGARLWSERSAATSPLGAWVQDAYAATTSGPDGRFLLTGIDPGPALVRVEAPGLARLYQRVEPEPEQWALEVGEWPLWQGSTVRIHSPEDLGAGAVARIDLRGDWLEPDMLMAPLEAGKALIKHVPQGSFILTAQLGEELLCEETLTVPIGPDEVDVECRAAESIVRGLVLAGGQSAGAGWLSWAPGKARSPGVIMRVGGGLLGRANAHWGGRPDVGVKVGADGSFVSDRLRPGAWKVRWQPRSGTASALLDVELPQGEVREVRLEFPGRRVLGIVVDGGERPVAGARVSDLEGGAVSISAPDGGFELSIAEDRPLRLQARKDERSSEVLLLAPAGEIEPGQIRLVIEKREDEIPVLVAKANGDAIPGAFVFLEEAGKGIRLLTTSLDGRVAAKIHPPRSGRFRAAAFAAGSWALGEWHDRAAALEGIRVVFEQSSPEEASTLRMEVAQPSARPRVVAATGWDLTALLARLGRRLESAGDAVLLLRGLPAGTYEVSVGSRYQRVAIGAGEVGEVTLSAGLS